jgi:hypothetical protein
MRSNELHKKSPTKQLCHQKDLGIVVTKDLKWTKQVEEITSKASSMLGFIRRTASDPRAKGLVPVLSAQQVRICQPGVGTSNCHRHTVNRMGSTSRDQIHPFPSLQNSHNIQGTTTRYRYSPSLLLARIFRLSFPYKSILSNDVNVSIRRTTRTTRNADSVNGILIHPDAGQLATRTRCRTVSYKNPMQDS